MFCGHVTHAYCCLLELLMRIVMGIGKFPVLEDFCQLDIYYLLLSECISTHAILLVSYLLLPS